MAAATETLPESLCVGQLSDATIAVGPHGTAMADVRSTEYSDATMVASLHGPAMADVQSTERGNGVPGHNVEPAGMTATATESARKTSAPLEPEPINDVSKAVSPPNARSNERVVTWQQFRQIRALSEARALRLLEPILCAVYRPLMELCVQRQWAALQLQSIAHGRQARKRARLRSASTVPNGTASADDDPLRRKLLDLLSRDSLGTCVCKHDLLRDGSPLSASLTYAYAHAVMGTDGLNAQSGGLPENYGKDSASAIAGGAISADAALHASAVTIAGGAASADAVSHALAGSGSLAQLGPARAITDGAVSAPGTVAALSLCFHRLHPSCAGLLGHTPPFRRAEFSLSASPPGCGGPHTEP